MKTEPAVVLLSLVSAALISACSSGSDDKEPRVYKSDQSVQCDADSGIPLETMANELISAGIDVLCSQKAGDGLAHPTICGESTGVINVYEIRGVTLDDAETLGFRSLSELPADYPACEP